MQNENGRGNELYERLFREAELNPQRDHLLLRLAEYPPGEVIPVMLNILQEDADKMTGATAIEVIEMIGYPKNKAALPTLIVFLGADGNDPRYSAAGNALLRLSPDVLVPDLMRVLLGQTESYFGDADFFRDFNWSDIVDGICSLVGWKKADKEYARRCCPSVNYLLSQDPPVQSVRIDRLLKVIERVALEAEYVLPTLIKFVQHHPEDPQKDRVWQLLLSFPKEALMPYEPLLEELFS